MSDGSRVLKSGRSCIIRAKVSNELSRDLSSAKGLKLIRDVSESIKRELDILIVISLEAVEEVAKDTDSLISLG